MFSVFSIVMIVVSVACGWVLWMHRRLFRAVAQVQKAKAAFEQEALDHMYCLEQTDEAAAAWCDDWLGAETDALLAAYVRFICDNAAIEISEGAASARVAFNNAASSYNAAIETPPGSWLARMYHLHCETLLE